MNTAPGIPNRKRKKSDANNDQVNAQVKCQNEKRRRELENAYISELARLISTTDMAQNGKKDKCVILQETVNQIKNIKGQQEGTADAVQQGEVSSSRPAISAHDFGPLLLEALESFVFIVNSECRIEYITENVTEFLKYRREELQGNSIYNYIHHGDHHNFSSILVPMIRSAYAYQSDTQKPRSLVCRMLVKNPFESTETMEEKQQRVSEYENMQLSILKKMKSPESAGSDPAQDGSDGHLLVCIARKTAEAKGGGGGGGGGGPAETVITRLDPSGRIVGVETQNLTPSHGQHFTTDLVGQSLYGLVWPGDQTKVMAHIEKVVTSSDPGPHPLDDVRLRGLVAGSYFRVQTRTKCFKNAEHGVFINCMHTICGEEVVPEPVAASPRGGLLSPSGQMGGPRAAPRPLSAGLSPGGGGPGGPGGGGGGGFAFSSTVSSLPVSLGNTITLSTSAGFSTLTVPSDVYNDSDILSELFSSGPLDGFSGGGGDSSGFSSGGGAPPASAPPPARAAPATGGHMYVNTSASVGGSRPSSRQSHNSTPTPHPASLPSFSPAAQSSPQPFSAAGFQFSPPASAEFGRPSPAADADEGSLKGLLGPRSVSSDTLGDSKEGLLQGGLHGHDDESGQKLLLGGGGGGGGGGPAKPPASGGGGGDNMLRQLLNDRGDDRNEQRAKAKKNEELMLLLKSGGGAQPQQQQHPEHMLNALRRPSGGASPRVSEGFDITAGDLLRGHKRTSQDGDADPMRVTKKPVRYPSGGGMMELAPPAGSPQDANVHGLPAKNKMLAILLASTSSPSPTVPTTIAQQVRPSDLPQDKLPRPDELRSKLKDQVGRGRGPGGPGPAGQLTSLPEGADQMMVLGPGRPPQPPQQQQQQQPPSQQQQQQAAAMAAAVGGPLGRSMSVPITQGTPPQFFSSMPTGDELDLDNILDDIMNIESESQWDGDRQRQPNGGSRLPEANANNFNVNEKMAISEIRRSLMQAESSIARPGFTSSQPSGVRSSAAGFPPPYQQPRPRTGGFTSQINMVRSQMSQYPVSNQPRMTSHQALAHRNRLLEQQQQQQLLVNNASRGDINVSFQNMDNILNATPPNVSLQVGLQQRLVGGGQESQASPSYSSAVGVSPLGQLPSPGQPCPSPHSPSLGGQAGFPGYGAGGQVSPRAAPAPAAAPQPRGGPSPFSAQLSPGGPPPGAPGGAQARAAAVAAAAAGKLQQQNPELNAQLSGTFGIRGQSYQLPQRNAPMQRSQPPFPPSPQHQQLFQQQQQQIRLHRQSSAPPGPAAMAGGRHFGSDQLPRLMSPPAATQSYSSQASYPGQPAAPHPPHPGHPARPGHPGHPGHPANPPPQQLDMYGGVDDRVRPPPGSQAGAAGPAGGTGAPGGGGGGSGGGSSSYVRQELRRTIIGQRQQPGGRPLTQDDLEELGLEVPLSGHDTRWAVQQPPPPQPPESPGGAAGGGGGGGPPTLQSSLLRDLLMSD